MDDDNRIAKVTPKERQPGVPTPGMVREEALNVAGVWAGYVTTDPGGTSGWHHHGEHESVIYVVDGVMKLEFGHHGAESLEARSGDFVRVPKWAVHREINPAGDQNHLIVFRAGEGEIVVNVDGPEETGRG